MHFDFIPISKRQWNNIGSLFSLTSYCHLMMSLNVFYRSPLITVFSGVLCRCDSSKWTRSQLNSVRNWELTESAPPTFFVQCWRPLPAEPAPHYGSWWDLHWNLRQGKLSVPPPPPAWSQQRVDGQKVLSRAQRTRQPSGLITNQNQRSAHDKVTKIDLLTRLFFVKATTDLMLVSANRCSLPSDPWMLWLELYVSLRMTFLLTLRRSFSASFLLPNAMSQSGIRSENFI